MIHFLSTFSRNDRNFSLMHHGKNVQDHGKNSQIGLFGTHQISIPSANFCLTPPRFHATSQKGLFTPSRTPKTPFTHHALMPASRNHAIIFAFLRKPRWALVRRHVRPILSKINPSVGQVYNLNSTRIQNANVRNQAPKPKYSFLLS